jgi:hypothetical protein
VSRPVSKRITHGVAAAAAVTLGGLLVAAPLASAAPADAVTNGSFQQPGAEGANPTGWTPSDFGTETAPYSADINTYEVNDQYKPPTGTPGGDVAGNYASEDFYEVGSNTGVEGFGGDQAFTTPVAGTTDPQVSWATAEDYSPPVGAASWAGSVVEVDLLSGTTTYQLRYINPFTPDTGSYSDSPVQSDTATTKYMVLSALTPDDWYVQPARDVAADARAQFGLTSFSVAGIAYGNLESVTATYPYANMTSWWKDISLQTGTGPAPALAESPLTVGLPLAGIGVAAVAVTSRRRRRAA